MADDADTRRLLQQSLGHRSERDSRRRLPSAGALEDGTGIVERVLLHTYEIRVAWSRARQGGVAREVGKDSRIHRVRRHDLLPLRPFAVADPDRDRRSDRLPVTDATDDIDLVLLEAHPCTAAMTSPSPRQLVPDVVGGHPHTGGHTFENGDERRTMRLAGG